MLPMLDCTAATQASLAAGVGGAAGLRHPTVVTICCRDASQMGRRRDRRHATLGGGGRRVKLDLWPDEDVPSKLTGMHDAWVEGYWG